MPIVDPGLVLTTEPRQLLHQLLRVPDLDGLRAHAGFQPLSPQPRRHRVHVALHPDRAPLAHPHRQPFPGFQPPRRQGPQPGHLGGHGSTARPVPPPHQLQHPRPVRLATGKLPAPPQEQGLLHRLLEAPMGLLDVPVLMPRRRVGRLRHQPVVGQQGPVLRRVHFRVPVLMHRQTHPVRPMPGRHAPQRPQGFLQALTQAGETLGKTQADVLPVRLGQDKMVDQVGEGLPLDRHRQGGHLREVGGPQPTRLMHLREEHFLGRAVLRLPPPHPPLQRPPMHRPVLLGLLLLQPLQEGLGLQPRLPLQQGFQPGPHRRQRILPGPVGPRGFPLTR
jgi:hypothetical protein